MAYLSVFHNNKRMLFQFLFFIFLLFSFSFFITGCGESGGSDSQDSNTSNPKSSNQVTIQGSVNDAPVSHAEIRLVLKSINKEITTLTADENGSWSYLIEKNNLPANSFIIIYATNPANNASIRSVIDTDEILESEDVYKTDETTVSHYTEAAIILAEEDGAIDQEKYDTLTQLVTLENGEPAPTGNEELDNLAATVQTNFDDKESNQDRLTLAVYKDLLTQNISSVVPDEYGDVDIELPVEYNDEITITTELNTSNNPSLTNERLTFTLTPAQRQEDMNVTLLMRLNDETLDADILLYAIGNSKDHYKYASIAPTSNSTAAKSTVMINGRNYTLIPYSFIKLDQSSAATESIRIDGTLRGKSFNSLQIASNYANAKTLIRVYEGKENFTPNSLVGESDIITLSSNSVALENLAVTRVDDYRPIAPTDTNIEMPPLAPQF